MIASVMPRLITRETNFLFRRATRCSGPVGSYSSASSSYGDPAVNQGRTPRWTLMPRR